MVSTDQEPPLPQELKAMSQLATLLINRFGEDQYIDRLRLTASRVARVAGLTLCRHADGVTIRQAEAPFTLVYAESPDGEPEGCDPALLRSYTAKIQQRFPLDSLTVI